MLSLSGLVSQDRSESTPDSTRKLRAEAFNQESSCCRAVGICREWPEAPPYLLSERECASDNSDIDVPATFENPRVNSACR